MELFWLASLVSMKGEAVQVHMAVQTEGYNGIVWICQYFDFNPFLSKIDETKIKIEPQIGQKISMAFTVNISERLL